MERYKTPSAVYLMLIKGDDILLQKRAGEKWGSGWYDVSASGHVEENESMRSAICRETKEEIDIEVSPEDLEFVCLMHSHYDNVNYYNGYFRPKKWTGIPKINEPDKCSDLMWVNIDNLPSNVLPDRKLAIENYKKNIKYSEFGWNND